MAITTNADSPDTLPMVRYTMDQLQGYIYRQLGYPTWQVEITAQAVNDCIQDALQMWSQWVPQIRYQSVRLVGDTYQYLQGQNMGLGVVQVDFVEPLPTPTAIFYGNLIDPAPLFKTGLDEYDMFLRWRKTWMRVTSVRPDWLWDESRQVLFVHNPIERYHAGVVAHFYYDRTETLPYVGADWVKRYALEKARFLYGEILAKFSGAIPGPLKDLQLDSQKRDKAEKRLDELREEVRLKQLSTSISID
jgi:hypothetical protein